MSEYSTLHKKLYPVLSLLLFSFTNMDPGSAIFLTFYILLHSTGNHTELFTRKNKNSNKRFQYVKCARII